MSVLVVGESGNTLAQSKAAPFKSPSKQRGLGPGSEPGVGAVDPLGEAAGVVDLLGVWTDSPHLCSNSFNNFLHSWFREGSERYWLLSS